MDDILESMVPGRWVYEQELVGTDGTVRYPDFTIETTTGRRIVWEHLGMLDDPQYAANWKAKKQWYRANGMLPWPDGGGPEGTLVWTDDRGGGDVPCLATARTASVRWTVEGKSSNQKDPGHEGAAQEAGQDSQAPGLSTQPQRTRAAARCAGVVTRVAVRTCTSSPAM